MEPRIIAQTLSLVISSVSVIVLAYNYIRAQSVVKRLLLVAPLLCLLHAAVYYSLLALEMAGLIDIHAVSFRTWSSWLTLNLIVTVAIMAYVNLRRT